MIRLMDALDDHEDVKQVWSNFDIEEKEIEASLASGSSASTRFEPHRIRLHRQRRRVHQLVRCGAVNAGAGATFPDQLSIIYRALSALLAEHQPECVAIENIFHAMNARSA